MRVALLTIATALVACGGGATAAPEAPGDWDVEVPEALDRRDAGSARRPAPPPRVWSPPAARSGGERPERIYRGRRIDLDLRDADLHNVFRLLADVGGVNVVVSDDVRGEVTLRLRRVPWDQALEVVARMEGLALRRHGDIYLVTTR